MNLNRIKKDFPYHQNKEDDFYVIELAKSYHYCGIRNFDFSNTNVSYDAILAMWRSDTVGSYMGNTKRTYQKQYNKLISMVYIEIQNSKVYEQYQTYKHVPIANLFTLPYRDHFMIDCGEDGIISGLKEIVFVVSGRQLTDDMVQ